MPVLQGQLGLLFGFRLKLQIYELSWYGWIEHD